jgi:6-phosphogluconolactonase (cycloisomerase 2 family)
LALAGIGSTWSALRLSAGEVLLNGRRGWFTPLVGAGCLFALVLIFALRAEAQPVGSLIELGCVSETGAGPCVDGKGLNGASSVAASPDGTSVYVASRASDAVAAFRRSVTTGQLTQLAVTFGCVSETGSGGTCADGRALDDPSSVAVSPDGKQVYVASQTSDAVAVFARDTTTGRISQLAGTAGCVSETGTGGQCTDGKALNGAASVTVSDGGKSVYVASNVSNAVAVFKRNATTGALTQATDTTGCISHTGSGGQCALGKALAGAASVAVSAGGTSVYVASSVSDAVAVLKRNTTTGNLTQSTGTDACVSETGSGGACVDGKGLDGAASVAVSSRGTNVYVASSVSDALAAFGRNTTTGKVTQLGGTLGCFSETGSGGQCSDGRGLDGARSVAVSESGKSIYVASEISGAIAAFSRSSGSFGQLTQLAATAGCISETGSVGECADGRALDGAASVTLSPDGENVYAASKVSAAVAVFARKTNLGRLTQLPGLSGCTSEDGSGGACADGKALVEASSVAVSVDGKHVYVASRTADAVAVFRRNLNNGALTQLAGTAGCVSLTGSGGTCARGRALDGATSVAITAGGKSVYVASRVSDAVAVFTRDATTGALTQLSGTAGCVSETGSGGTCADGKALDGASSVVASANGGNVYAASRASDAVAVFGRNVTTGQLTQMGGTAGCVSETGSAGACADGKALDGAVSVALSADGVSAYVASDTSDAVAAFSRAPGGRLTQLAGLAGCVSETGSAGACADGKALDGAASVAVSPDRKSVYVASTVSDAVAALGRDITTGALTQPTGLTGCVSETGSAGACADGRALDGAASVAVSPDNKTVYAASTGSDAVAVFTRNMTSGALRQLSGTSGCVSETGAGPCADGRALDGAASVAVGADGTNVYVASAVSDAIAAFRREGST